MSTKQHRAVLTPFENMLLGVFGGCLETCVHMPLLTWKFARQNSTPLPKNIAGWYRGVVVQASSVAPITALQVVANGVIEGLVTGKKRPVTDTEKIGTSALAGFISAMIYSPVDLITIQQQHRSKAMLETFRDIRKEFGLRILYKGFLSCGLRECVYACGYLGMAPVFTDYFKRKGSSTRSDFYYSLCGALSAGLISAYATHPVDTVKTVYQADISGAKYRGTLDAAKDIYKKGGIRYFYKGAVPRCVRTMGAFFIISSCREKLIQWKTKKLYPAVKE